jgi:hypothetical protein
MTACLQVLAFFAAMRNSARLKRLLKGNADVFCGGRDGKGRE